MKLCNKKTGEIVETDCAFGVSVPTDRFMGCKSYDQIAEYNSLAELNEEWEDYKPAEPLIKDEKIRKAVRAWAESFAIDKNTSNINIKASKDFKEFWLDGYCMEFERTIEEIESEIDYKNYTIAELCGEEEE